MTKQPSKGDKSPKNTNKSNKLGVKSDTFSQVPDSDKVKGGMMSTPFEKSGRKPTYDPSETSGCCG